MGRKYFNLTEIRKTVSEPPPLPLSLFKEFCLSYSFIFTVLEMLILIAVTSPILYFKYIFNSSYFLSSLKGWEGDKFCVILSSVFDFCFFSSCCVDNEDFSALFYNS